MADIKTNSKVLVKTKKDTYEGILMPRTELADDEHIVIKLSSGYNIGILKKEIKEMKELEKPIEKRAISKVKFDKGKPPISLITTGGTITSKIDYETGGVRALADANELLDNVPELSKFVNIRDILQPFGIMGEDISHVEWGKIAELVAKELNSGSNGAIVTHGTDFLWMTSAALSFMLKNLSKPVAIVGAQRSTDRGSADAVQNMTCAAHYCRSDIAEVSIVMHANTADDYCIATRGTKVRKMHTTRRDAFRPINDLPFAKIWPDGNIMIENSNHRTRSDSKVVADTKFEEKVALVKAYPGSLPDLIDFYREKKYKGIIIEGSGLGHVPTKPVKKEMSWIPKVRAAVERGMFVGIAPQPLYGRVNPKVYSNLRLLKQAGAVFLEDLLPDTAYVKLGWVLGHTKDRQKAEEMMLTNYAGEINERIDPKSFLY